jgi:M6 family metalloprotease-like protein
MKKYLSPKVLMLIVVFTNIFIVAGPFDTKMTTLKQPNDVTFTGRIWGDEFIYWAETEDGYRFVQSSDGWYYYATLDGQGEFAPTNNKVGIDQPPAYSYQLERTQSRMDEIMLRIQEFSEGVERAGERFAEEQQEAPGGIVNWDVGVILIQFPDVPRFSDQEYRPNGYLKSDFDSMMFSYNYWVGQQGNELHPEEEAIYGSFRDYWYQMSKSKLRIDGQVVNDADENGVIEWLDADYDQYEYKYNLDYKTLSNEAINKAVVRNWISLNAGDPKYYNKLVIVFAQRSFISTNLMTYADSDSNYIQVSEQASEELFQTEDYTFTHMGVYAHEFGHNLGFRDEYRANDHYDDFESWTEDGGTDTYNFDLMSWGIYNGPLRKGECPATLSPYYRIKANWISSITLEADENNFVAEYDYEYPKVYRINPVSAIEDEHFLFESRGRDGYDKFIPWNPNDPTPQPGNLVIWYHNMQFVYGPTGATYTDRSRIINADDTMHWFSQLTDFFPANFDPGTQDFNDISTPATTMGYLVPGSYIGNYRPANFALNGIENLGNDNTSISEIRLFHPLKIVNEISGSWQMVSVPHILNDYSVEAVFPTRDPDAFVFNSNYQSVTTVENGPGYWVKFYPGQQDLEFQGVDLITYLEIPVVIGWQITGSISYEVPLPLNTNPPGIINSTIYRFDGTYQAVTDYIKPGVGYWLKTSEPGYIILDKDAQQGETEELNFDEMDKFIVTDAEGYNQTLYVSNIDIDTSAADINTELPPIFPELQFDSRFEYGELVKKVSADSGQIDINILVRTNSLPVSLSWEINPENGIDYSFIGDSTSGKASQILVKTGSTTFNKLNNSRIQLFANANKTVSSNLPTEYALQQNYPNPFNPTTTIEYDLPDASKISVTIYDILGRKVKELVNEKQDAGRYKIQFDASNFASGIYIYQLIADKFYSAMKMILLK